MWGANVGSTAPGLCTGTDKSAAGAGNAQAGHARVTISAAMDAPLAIAVHAAECHGPNPAHLAEGDDRDALAAGDAQAGHAQVVEVFAAQLGGAHCPPARLEKSCHPRIREDLCRVEGMRLNMFGISADGEQQYNTLRIPWHLRPTPSARLQHMCNPGVDQGVM